MRNSIFNTYGRFDPIPILITDLRAKLLEAQRAGDVAQCAMITRNLREFSNLCNTG